MRRDRTVKTLLRTSVAATLLCVGAFAVNATSVEPVSPVPTQPTAVAFSVEPRAITASEKEAQTAATTLVRSLSAGNADSVWLFATEEEQEAFATEDETFRAFVEAYPPLAFAAETVVDSVTTDGDTQLVALYVTDKQGLQWRAELGLWKDDAGDWKLVTCDIAPAPADDLV